MNFREFANFQTQNAEMNRVLTMADSICQSHAPVLISGAPGIGKTTLALQIGFRNKSYPYQVMFQKNMDPRGLKDGTCLIVENLESLEKEDQETLVSLLDIIRMGLKVRIIATADNYVKNYVEQGQLKRDLYFRLSVIHLKVPSLNERPEDILLLSDLLVKSTALILGHSKNYQLLESAKSKLKAYSWPFNVTELQTVLERAVTISQSGLIEDKHIQFEHIERKQMEFVGLTLAEMEKKLILQTLEMTKQNRTKAASVLGISIRTLRNKLSEYREAGVL
ncbi:MAG: helix-turn-helix domain-containing protein [Pseudobdellovibrionaceae bacterium]